MCERETGLSEPIEENNDSDLVPTEIPGMYTLPDHLILKDTELSPEYRQYCQYLATRRSLPNYIRYLISQIKK